MNGRPLVVFDGDCGFCRFWVARWRHRTGHRIDYEPFQNPAIAARFPHIPRDRFARAVHLLEPDGRTSEGALAIFRLLAISDRDGSVDLVRPDPAEPGRVADAAAAGRDIVGRLGRLLTAVYGRVPGASRVSERAYRVVADHRPFFARLTHLLWGGVEEPSTYAVAAWLFRRSIGVVYLLAFWSLAGQILGLVGHTGILPAESYLDAARGWASLEHAGIDRFRMFPTIFWAGTGDVFLRAVCLGGAGLSLLLIIGFAPLAVLPIVWFLYLSLSVVGQEFLSYQWDALLLEAGFLAIFIAPRGLRDRLRSAADPPRLGIGLLLWLLIRLMVGSGAAKLASGDPAWHHLTALSFHYETQPIPTPVAWYVHRLPAWFGRISTVVALAIEICVPLLAIAPRRARTLACVLLVGLQVLIALTGNYAFFNLLATALCVLLLDDAALSWLLSLSGADAHAAPRGWRPVVGRRVLVVVAIVTVPLSMLTFAGSAGIDVPGARLLTPLAELVRPFRSVNQYGLFAVMTTSRPEIVVEGSDDGVAWMEYEFRYKAGDLRRRPPWVAPYQPRLDWQMWFAALEPYDSNVWFEDFCARLLEASPDVLGLLARDPFEGRAPRYVRATLYRYRFSSAAEHRTTQAWWTRERTAEYSPVLSLNPGARRPVP